MQGHTTNSKLRVDMSPGPTAGDSSHDVENIFFSFFFSFLFCSTRLAGMVKRNISATFSGKKGVQSDFRTHRLYSSCTVG